MNEVFMNDMDNISKQELTIIRNKIANLDKDDQRKMARLFVVIFEINYRIRVEAINGSTSFISKDNICDAELKTLLPYMEEYYEKANINFKYDMYENDSFPAIQFTLTWHDIDTIMEEIECRIKEAVNDNQNHISYIIPNDIDYVRILTKVSRLIQDSYLKLSKLSLVENDNNQQLMVEWTYKSDSNKNDIEITFDIISALYDKRFNKFDTGISYRRSSLPGEWNYIIEECTGNYDRHTAADKDVKFREVGDKWEIQYNNPRIIDILDNELHGIHNKIVNNIMEVFRDIDEFFGIERTIDAEYINNIKKDIMEGNE